MRQLDNDATTRALGYIGIAKKAGRLASGTPNVCDALRRGAKYAVFMASDASESTKKRLSDKCAYYGAELYSLSCTCAELAHRVGKTGSVAAVTVTDAGLSRAAVGE